MATIEKLQLCGLRSFGPLEEDVQAVKFGSPLTLFLGENGCGKTTLIESLKFAISGDVPGGSKSGQAFVNDPKLNGMTTTKGQVRLKFADIKGNKYLVIKSVQLTDKGATYQFKRLDTTLERVNPDNTKQAISSRCADIDNDICDILGVSKAILNNVIFCHQEDAAWPLEEPKKLKEKFDEIFGASEYNKCAEHIRKMVKERGMSNKILQSRVEMLKQTADMVDRKRVNMQEKEEKLAKNEEDIKEKETRLQPINARLQEICDLETNLGKLQETRASKETTRKGLVEQQNDILKNISEEYAGSDEDLQKEVTSFEFNREKTEEKRKDLEKKKQSIEEEKEQLASSIGRLQVRMGKLQGEKNQQQETIADRNRLIEKTAAKLNIQVPNAFDSNTDVLAAVDGIRASLESSKCALDNLTRECDAEEAEAQKSVDLTRDKVIKVEHDMQSKGQILQETKNKARDITRRVRENDSSDEELKSVQTKITRADADLMACKAAFNADAVTKSINDEKQKRRQLEEQLETLEQEHKILQKNSIAEAELETQRHDLVKRRTEILKLQEKHYDSFGRIFDDNVPNPGVIKKTVDASKQTSSNKINDINKRIATKQKEATTLEAKQKFQTDKLQSLKNDLQANERKIFEMCKDKPFETVSNELHQTIEKLQKDKGQYSSAKIMYEKFVQDFEGQKPCCPVCHTDFGNKQAAVTQIVAMIRIKIQGIPQELKKVEEDLKIKQLQYSKLLQLKPTCDKVQELSSTEIPKLQSELTNLDGFYKRISNELNELTEQLVEPQNILDSCNKVVGDAALIDQQHLEINRAERKIGELELQLVQAPSNRSRQQAEVEIEDLKIDINNTRRNYETSQKKLQQHIDRCQELRESKSNHVLKLMKMQKAMQEKSQLQEQITELADKEQKLKEEHAELFEQWRPLRIDNADALKALQEVKANNKKKIKEAQDELHSNQKVFDDINKLQKSIDAYLTRDGDGAFETALQEITSLTGQVGNLEKNSAKVVVSITEVTKQLASQEGAFRTLNDNLILREKRKQQQALTEEIAVLKQQIGDHNYRSVLTEKQRLREQDDEFRREISRCVGRNDELKEEVKTLKAELNSPENKQAFTSYKKTLIEYKVRVKAVEDLTLYVNTLERSLLKFHQERMEQINKIIRQLWRSIYRGNDCDYIEIKTDQTRNNTARRSYNYKVVQKKGDAEIDMRGRCSAGQKVLACLVIRMALAEAFSKNCGILALDEPTTNLDRANISSLSDALARIVNSRQLEKNFQLIVITHDEEFLSTLRRVDKVSHFWRVSRNNKGNSVVTREML